MVIARTDLYVPKLKARPNRRRRFAVVLPERSGSLPRRFVAAVASVFARPVGSERPAARHRPVRRPEFVEGAAMSREMFRL